MTDERDQHFHENLLILGARIRIPAGMDERCWERCRDIFGGRSPAVRRASGLISLRPIRWTAVGLAAALVLGLGLTSWWGGSKPVEAAVVLSRLAEQATTSQLLEISFDNVRADDVKINGRLQLTDIGVAGDLKAEIQEGGANEVITADFSLALSENGGWILIRSLTFPDPDVQPFLAFFLPPGTTTLLQLPKEAAEHVPTDGFRDALSEVHDVATGEIVTFVKEVLQSLDKVGATARTQSDGTTLLTIDIKDAKSLESLLEIARRAFMDEFGDEDINIDDDEEGLLGCTLQIVYDPTGEQVRSFSVSALGDLEGRVTISLRPGPIEEGLMDSARVMTPATRVLDMGAIIPMLMQFSSEWNKNNGDAKE